MDQPEEFAGEYWESFANRLSHLRDINAAFAKHWSDWTMVEGCREAQRRGIVATPMLSPADILIDEHFASRGAMDIEGFGEQRVDLFVAEGLLADVADVFSLDYDRIATFEGFGEVSVANLRAAVDEARSQPLGRLLFGLRIPHVGTTVADLVARSFGDLDGLLAATVEDLEAVEGLGPVIAASVHDWLREERNRDLLERLRTAGLHLEAADAAGDDVPQVLEGMAVVVTGTLAGMGRDDARAAITARGGTSPGSVSKKTTALVAGENAGSKLAKAADLGIPVLDEAAFEVLLATGQLPG